MDCDFSNYVCPRCGTDARTLPGTSQRDRRLWRRMCISAPPGSAEPLAACGPGAELKELLAKIGIKATGNCPCQQHAEAMDRGGPGWCRENLETIVGWLRDAAHERKRRYTRQLAAQQADPIKSEPAPLPLSLRLPFSDRAARHLILLAIRRAERTILRQQRRTERVERRIV